VFCYGETVRNLEVPIALLTFITCTLASVIKLCNVGGEKIIYVVKPAARNTTPVSGRQKKKILCVFHLQRCARSKEQSLQSSISCQLNDPLFLNYGYCTHSSAFPKMAFRSKLSKLSTLGAEGAGRPLLLMLHVKLRSDVH